MIRTKAHLLALVFSLALPTVPFAGYALEPTVSRSLALREVAATNLGIPRGATPVILEPGREGASTILVEVRRLRSDRGHVLGALFGSADGWGIEGRQVAVCRSRIVHARAYCPLEDLPAGSYGFAFMHDENDNERMDTNFLGLPDEGFGFSNDAPVSFGPPSFDAVRFRHEGAVTALVVQARYGI